MRGLETGADDYIAKPFSPRLVARIKAVMRRISPMAVEEVIEMQGLSLDRLSPRDDRRQPRWIWGRPNLNYSFLYDAPGTGLQPQQLLNHVWGTNGVEDRLVDVHIRRLRKALEHSGHDRMNKRYAGRGIVFDPQCQHRQLITGFWRRRLRCEGV